MGDGRDRFQPGTWEDMERVGGIAADEAIGCIDGGLRPVKPLLASAITEVAWPMEPPPSRDEYAAIAAEVGAGEVRRAWAQEIVEALDAGKGLPREVNLTLQGIRIGEGLRIAALEGEAVAGYGTLMCGFYGNGVTFALGYSNGEGLYLPTSPMLDEGGYEVVSFWEYGFPARLAPGFEDILRAGLRRLREAGVR
jgi:hypothetical protein